LTWRGLLTLTLASILASACGGETTPSERAVGPRAALSNGAACTGDSQCDTSHCVDGVCCDSACAGTCQACAAALKQSLSDDGTCGVVLAGLDPHDDCAPAAECGATGQCDGKGACALAPVGAPCTADGSSSACINGSNNVKGPNCDGSGACVVDGSASGKPCAPYLCKGNACTFPCANDGDCQVPNRCEGGVCKPKRQTGSVCTDSNQCSQGFCVDGFCCDSTCNGGCQTCAGSNPGHCENVVGSPPAGKPSCADASFGCAASCLGQPACSFPASGTECDPATCQGDSLIPASVCDGAGVCNPQAAVSCLPYSCDTNGKQCFATCTTTLECGGGAACDGTGSCVIVTGGTCKDDFTVELPDGTEASCVPYKCLAGKCQQQCVTSGDCAAGYACAGSACVAADSGAGGGSTGGATNSGASSGKGGSPSGGGTAASNGAGDSGGCGCRAASRAPSRFADLLMLGALLLLRRRRSRARTVLVDAPSLRA
jgi:hypothetical protein